MNPLASKTALFCLVIIGVLTTSIQCKPFATSRSSDRDPILAMPSEQDFTYRGHQPMQYEREYQAVAQPHASYAPTRYQASSGRQYVLVEQSVQSESNKREPEYTNMMAGQDEGAQSGGSQQRGSYPAEIVYVNQNNEMAKAPGKQSSPTADEISNMAGLISHNSGLAATILTEVPVKDMPHDVLEKLKKDYGVKVVATRSYPGANLIINCEDYAGSENIVCTPRPEYRYASRQVVHHELQPVRDSEEPTSAGPVSEQPQIPSEIQAKPESTYSREESSEADGRGATVEVDPSVAPEQPQEERYVYVHEGENSSESSGQTKPEDQSSASVGRAETNQPELSQPQAGAGEQYQSGFEDPSPGVDEDSEQGSFYVARR